MIDSFLGEARATRRMEGRNEPGERAEWSSCRSDATQELRRYKERRERGYRRVRGREEKRERAVLVVVGPVR